MALASLPFVELTQRYAGILPVSSHSPFSARLALLDVRG
jgi:hypothetical protein